MGNAPQHGVGMHYDMQSDVRQLPGDGSITWQELWGLHWDRPDAFLEKLADSLETALYDHFLAEHIYSYDYKGVGDIPSHLLKLDPDYDEAHDESGLLSNVLWHMYLPIEGGGLSHGDLELARAGRYSREGTRVGGGLPCCLLERVSAMRPVLRGRVLWYLQERISYKEVVEHVTKSMPLGDEAPVDGRFLQAVHVRTELVSHLCGLFGEWVCNRRHSAFRVAEHMVDLVVEQASREDVPEVPPDVPEVPPPEVQEGLARVHVQQPMAFVAEPPEGAKVPRLRKQKRAYPPEEEAVTSFPPQRPPPPPECASRGVPTEPVCNKMVQNTKAKKRGQQEYTTDTPLGQVGDPQLDDVVHVLQRRGHSWPNAEEELAKRRREDTSMNNEIDGQP